MSGKRCKHIGRLFVTEYATVPLCTWLLNGAVDCTGEGDAYPDDLIIVECRDCGRTVRARRVENFPRWAVRAIGVIQQARRNSGN